MKIIKNVFLTTVMAGVALYYHRSAENKRLLIERYTDIVDICADEGSEDLSDRDTADILTSYNNLHQLTTVVKKDISEANATNGPFAEMSFVERNIVIGAMQGSYLDLKSALGKHLFEMNKRWLTT